MNLLQAVTNPALYREVADAAIGFLARRSGDNLSGPSRNALVNCLTTPGPDPEVHSAAARILSSLSEAQLVKTNGDL